MQLGALKGYLVLASDIDVAVFNLTTMSRVNPVPLLPSSASVRAGLNKLRSVTMPRSGGEAVRKGVSENPVSKRKRRIEQQKR